MNEHESERIEAGSNAGGINRQSHRPHERLLPLWPVAASVIAALLIGLLLFLGWRLFRESRRQVAGPDATPEEVSKSPPASTASETASVDVTTPAESKPPPQPPLPDIYISDLKPLKFSSGWGRSGINQSVVGNPLTVGGNTYEHGLGTHATGEAIFDIPAEARRFVALVGLDDEVVDDQWRRGSVCFEVYGEVNETGEAPVLLSQSPVLSSKTIRVWAFDLELESRFKRVQLVVSDAGDGSECDHADWVNAGFLK